jgi:uncharacterized protein (TIGR03382 family)
VAPIDGRVFVGRFTVESLTGFMTDESADRSLAGTLFVFPEGAGQGTVIEISNAFVPTPGAAALLGVAGLGLLRRRR